MGAVAELCPTMYTLCRNTQSMLHNLPRSSCANVKMKGRGVITQGDKLEQEGSFFASLPAPRRQEEGDRREGKRGQWGGS